MSSATNVNPWEHILPISADCQIRDTSTCLGSQSEAGGEPGSVNKVDLREQLVNNGDTGRIDMVSIPEAMIVRLRGILIDLDPKWLRADKLPPGALADPDCFYDKYIKLLLSRHPVFNAAEVRASGLGLHAILRFVEPIEFSTSGLRERWAGIVKVIQRLLPSDPHCPGITATTRPVGSINSKNNQIVRQLEAGSAILPEQVLALYEAARSKPFFTLATHLFGKDVITPCPVCNQPGTQLRATDQLGYCYGSCGKVKLGQLFDAVMIQNSPVQGG